MENSPCPLRSSLKDLAVGRLPLERHEAVEAHVRQCANCQAELESLEDVQDPILSTMRELLDPRPIQAIPIVKEAVARLKSLDAASASGGASSRNIAGTQFPKMLGDFHILRELGRGGMGIVYQAEQVSLKRHVALKTLPSAILLDSRQLRRFQKEARVAAGLEHPNIVKVFGVGTEDGVHFYAMQYIDGFNLAEIIERFRQQAKDGRPCGVRECGSLVSDVAAPSGLTDFLQQRAPRDAAYIAEAVRIGIQAAQALEYAHRHDIVHRDIKPSNLMLDQTGNLWVTDFGLAYIQADPTLSVSGSLLGTMRYMSPEQALGKRDAMDHQTDIYSLGVTLYELLTLRPIFPDATGGTMVARIVTDEPLSPRRLNPAIPIDLETIVLKSIAKNAAERYATAGDVVADLQRFLNREPIHARPVGPVRRAIKWSRRRPALAGLLVVSALTTLALLIGGWWHAVSLQSLLTEVERQRESAVKHEALAVEREQRVRHFLYTGDMKQAFVAWNNSHLAETLQLLERHRPQPGEEDLRSFVWYYLWRLCHIEILTLFGHTGIVHAVAFSPDGRTLATGSHDGTVKLWDTATGKTLVTLLEGHKEEVDAVAFSPDGRTLATGSDDHAVRLWDVATGKEQAVLAGHTSDVYAVAFSPDGKILASGGPDRLLKLWEISTGTELATLVGHQGAIESLAFSRDGKTVATASGDRTAILWDIASRKPKLTLKGHEDIVRCVAFAHEGQILATGGDDRSVKLWNQVTGEEIAALPQHSEVVRSVAFSPDDRYLAAALGNGSVALWNMTTRQPHSAIRGHGGRIWNVVFSPDGKTLATAGNDGTAKLWSMTADQRATVVSDLPAQVSSLAFTDDDRALAWLVINNAQERAPSRELYEIDEHGIVRRTLQVPIEGADTGLEYCTAFSPRGDRLAALYKSGSSQVQAEIYDLTSRKLGKPINLDDPGNVRSIHPLYCTWLPDSGRLAILRRDRARIEIRDAMSGSLLTTLQHSTGNIPFQAMEFSPDGATLATVDVDDTLMFWDVARSHVRGTNLAHVFSRHGLAFSPDSRTLATAGSDQTIQLWDVATMQPRNTLRGEETSTNCMAFSPDGKILAAGDMEGSLHFWDTNTWQELATIKVHRTAIYHLVFSPDGQRLASGIQGRQREKGEIAIWSAPRVEVGSPEQ